MFKNYLKIALRNIKKQRIYSVINITGLAVGLAIALVLGFYVLDDLTYDSCHRDAHRIFRLLTKNKNNGNTNAIVPGPLIVAARDDIPEVSGATRLTTFGRIPIGRPNNFQ